jgi:hypothetical protein
MLIIVPLLYHNLFPRVRVMLEELKVSQIYLITVEFAVDLDSVKRWR